MKETYTMEEYRYIFEKDENRAFIRLIIPEIGKLPQDHTLDEIVRIKKYASVITNRIMENK